MPCWAKGLLVFGAVVAVIVARAVWLLLKDLKDQE